jgi:hypothetical protein
MTLTKTWRVAIAIAPMLAITSGASAQGTDVATAQVLFDDAKRLMLANNFAEACPKFLASERLDPKVGTMLNLADCYEKNGQTASAWARFLEAKTMAERAGQTEREAFARDRAAALARRLSKLTVVLSAEARPIAGLQVKRDDVPIDPAALGIAAPVDPGAHVIEVTAPGRQTWSTKVDVGADGAQETVEVPRLAEAEAKTETAATSVTTKSDVPAQRKLAIAAGGVGVAGVAIGSVLGVLAMTKWSDAKDGCDEAGCTGASVSEGQSAETLGNLSTVGFIVGGVALAAAAVLWFTAPTKKRAFLTHGTF